MFQNWFGWTFFSVFIGYSKIQLLPRKPKISQMRFVEMVFPCENSNAIKFESEVHRKISLSHRNLMIFCHKMECNEKRTESKKIGI